jgi:cytochrome c nitrite reductase small subunit
MASDEKPKPNMPAAKVTGPRRRRRLQVLAGLVVLLALLGFGALALGTPVSEQPTSCIVCHDMVPFYDAWKVGAHSGGKATCVDCHVDQGLLNHWVNSVVALREVAGEVAGQGKFPRADVILPSSRCIRCHPSQRDTLVNIKVTHAGHASAVTCGQCHIQTGHAVTNAALAQAGALDAARASALRIAAMPKSQAWVLPGTTPMSAAHPPNSCWACHDPAKVGCTYCHTNNPHPGLTSNCADCHKPPAGHFTSGCAQCHRLGRPFNQPLFSHPAAGEQHTWQSFPCVDCHPNGYATADCTTCHARQGVGD